jgi:hypothetical protein
MPRKLPPKQDEKPQFERFIEAAKQAEAAETDADLSDVIRRVAPVKPQAANRRGQKS